MRSLNRLSNPAADTRPRLPMAIPEKLLLLLCLLLLGGGCQPEEWLPDFSTPELPQLELVAVTPVDYSRVLEPSGLVFHQGELFTVADKVDDTVFRIVYQPGQSARLEPAVTFNPPGRGAHDWEGLTVTGDHAFVLASETMGRLLKVSRNGAANWLTPDLREVGREVGLFAKRNAAMEGVTALHTQGFLIAAEREPRGILRWTANRETTAQASPASPFLSSLPLTRLPDYSGLAMDDPGQVFALFRNAHLVVQLKENADGLWSEVHAWSYRRIETDPRWAYRNQTYGMAEGLAVHGNRVFLIFDNNRGARQADPNDFRPILIEARFPETQN